MCGISGILTLDRSNHSSILIRLKDSLTYLNHRGPDSHGFWCDENKGIYLGHTRLSILDLTNSGAQPMISFSSRYIISFNGEIYNHLDLREEIQSLNARIKWKSTSDTETILQAIETFGFEDAISKFNGMFSLAVYDSLNEKLYLARDRFGEKPLYYFSDHRNLFFASELKALRKLLSFRPDISLESLNEYFERGYISAPRSIYSMVFKLLPGSYIVFARNSINSGDHHVYWDSSKRIIDHENNRKYDKQVEQDILLDLLEKSVKRRMISDVPTGAFLSGGIDSSLITAIMQKLSDKPVETFTIGFKDKIFDESVYAREIASFLGTRHNEYILADEEVLNVARNIAKHYDEPFADSSNIPTYLVCEKAKKKVTVVLTGDGADEIFGGYQRYTIAHRMWNFISIIPYQLRRLISKILKILKPKSYKNLFQILLPKFEGKIFQIGDKVHRFADLIISRTFADLYYRLTTIPSPYNRLILNESLYLNHEYRCDSFKKIKDEFTEMMRFDILNYLPDDILCKVDRASMSVSLETRAPYLDHLLVNFSWKLPMPLKINRKSRKVLLKKALYTLISKDLVDRPKKGFSVPIDYWLRNELKSWADELLNKDEIENQGFLDSEKVMKIWNEHLSEDRNWGQIIWTILMFQSWLKNHYYST